MKKPMNWIEGMSLELKGKKIKERMRYLRNELTAEGHLDGWVLTGLKKEYEELKRQIKI